MNENILILPKFKEGIILDQENEALFSYDLNIDNEINYTTEGKLVEICSEMAKEIESYYGIRVGDYGVEVKDIVHHLGDVVA